MRLARVRADGQLATVAALSDRALVRTDWLAKELPADDPVALLAVPGARERLERRLTGLLRAVAEGEVSLGWLRQEGIVYHMDDVTFAPPVAACGKCIAVALNYKAHAAEGNFVPPAEPSYFFKAPTCLVGHGETVVAPSCTDRLEYEIELAVVIGQRARRLTAENWQEAVAGYTILNDVTARDLQWHALHANLQWSHTKSFDTFGPVGPWLVTPDEVGDPQELELELRVGDQVQQRSTTRQMIFPVGQLLQVISATMTLEPGDIIATGTPEGIGRVAHGQVMNATISRLGSLVSPVAYEVELAAAARGGSL